jgi:hypothetical protein
MLSDRCALIAAAALLAACTPRASTPAATSSGQAEAPNPYGVSAASTVADVHALLIRPGSDRLYAAESDAPASDDGWKSVEAAAQKLADGADLLAVGPRARDQGDWVRLSKAVADNARKSLAAAQKKDVEALADADGTFTGYCEDCHKTYRDSGKGMMSQPDK